MATACYLSGILTGLHDQTEGGKEEVDEFGGIRVMDVGLQFGLQTEPEIRLQTDCFGNSMCLESDDKVIFCTF